MEGFRTRHAVVVRQVAGQLGIFALLAHLLDEHGGDVGTGLEVVMSDLLQRHVVDRNFAVDQHYRNTGLFGLFDRRDAGGGVGVVENNALHFFADGGVDQLALLLHVFAVRQHRGFVAQLLRLEVGAPGFRSVIGIIQRVDEDHDGAFLRREAGAGEEAGGDRGAQQGADFHGDILSSICRGVRLWGWCCITR